MEGITRLTVDMPTEEHMYLKLAAASEKMSMKAFVLKATFAAMEELEDNFLLQEANETLDKLEAGEEEVFLLSDIKEELLR